MTTAPRPRFRLGFLTHVQGRGDDLAVTYRNAQELFVVADELGFDVGWVAQHHAPLGGGGLSSPWTFLANAAARTTHIRLATAITILPLEDPLRLAEDVSVVGCDDSVLAALSSPALTSVRVDYTEFGAAASAALLAEMTVEEKAAQLGSAWRNSATVPPGARDAAPASSVTSPTWPDVMTQSPTRRTGE